MKRWVCPSILKALFDIISSILQYVKDSSLEKTLMALSKREYSWEELQQRPLPDGVDPAKLEKYLSDSDFEVCHIV